MKNIYTIKYDDFDDILNCLVDIYNLADSSFCLISDKYTTEYTMIDLLTDDDVEVDEIFLFESEFPMYVGLDDDAKLYVDDIEELGYLDYDCVFIDMDCIDEYKEILTDCIKKCADKDITIILFGDKEEYDLDIDDNEINEALDRWIKDKEYDEDIEFEAINIGVEENNGKTTVTLNCTDGVEIDDILQFIECFFEK